MGIEHVLVWGALVATCCVQYVDAHVVMESGMCSNACVDELLYVDTQKCFCETCQCGPFGYLDQQSGDCLERGECFRMLDDKCPNNQVRVACTECLETCDEPFKSHYCSESFFCGRNEGSGCGCPKGLVLDERSKFCVKPDQCKNECPLNQVKKACASCQDTCEQPNLQSRCLCEAGSDDGCGCLSGQYLDKDSGTCVEQSECRKILNGKCPRNQKWVECGGISVFQNCEASCDYPDGNANCQSEISCQANDLGGCGCKGKRLLDKSSGRCVTPRRCRRIKNKECPDNQIYKPCAVCENTCQIPNMKERCLVTSSCGINTGGGCGCPDGLVLNEDTNRCVKLNECGFSTARGCPEGSEYFDDPTECRSHCPPTCEGPKVEQCNTACLTKGCQCPKNMVHRLSDNKCVPRRQCGDDDN